MNSSSFITPSIHPPGGTGQAGQLKILLQDRQSRLYLQKAHQWTSSRDEAMDFQHSAKASGFVLQSKIPNMDIILSFPDSKYDLRIPCSLPSWNAVQSG
ncbi:hypothetical protein [Pedosphaera parvula]|uniref:Uncharacterized protein n=1 Tax=Pedosphaera parvula (strain Ellin514) TaxID=320771 RepID=B9XQW7_PEDPL|nr:hypothetical protein [Pedosphaera parvula]EEF57744.1 hypothetical protein Cflav_PD0626 [Pedosphaera parvula Ellin514]